MANQITDRRTLLDSANANTNWTDLGGTTAGTVDTEVKVQGTGSLGNYTTSSIAGLMYNYGSTQNLTGNTVYIRVNCGIVGLLDTKANGGFRIRFAGPTASNYFEVRVGGSDSWPTVNVAGGWVMFVVDVTLARSTAVANLWTGGVPPALTAIQRVGYAAITGGTMPRMADNTWIDELRILPANTAGIRVEGRSGGTTPWTLAQIYTQLGDATGTFLPAPGGAYACNTPIEIAIDDASTHAVTSENELLLWANQEYAGTGLYGITVNGAASGTVNVNFGVKTGTGDTASGAQGAIIAAAGTGVRWFFTANAANIDACNLYGCTFKHGAQFAIGAASVETIGSSFIDCVGVTVTNSLFLKNKVITPANGDGVGFAVTDDMTDIRFCTFEFQDGHAVTMTTPLDGAQESRGNLFVGAYGGSAGSNLIAGTGSTDAMVFNNAGGAVTLSITNGGTVPSVRNGAGATTTISLSPVTTLVQVKDENGNALQNAVVLVEAGSSTVNMPYEATVTITASGTTASVSHTLHGMSAGAWVTIRNAAEHQYNGVFAISNVTLNGYDYTMGSAPTSPATIASGKSVITSTGVVISGLTDSSGEVSDSRTYTVDQPVRYSIRKSTGSPRYVPVPSGETDWLTATVSSSVGLTIRQQMQRDD